MKKSPGRQYYFLGPLALVAGLLFGNSARAASPVSVNPPAAPVSASQTSLAFTVTADNTNVSAGQTVSVHVLVTNTGAVMAKHVRIDLPLPQGFQFVSAHSVGMLASLGDLPSGETITKTVALKISAAVPADRYALEPVVAAANADATQAVVALNVQQQRVLGAMTSLPETGATLIWIFAIAGLFLATGLGWLVRSNT